MATVAGRAYFVATAFTPDRRQLYAVPRLPQRRERELFGFSAPLWHTVDNFTAAAGVSPRDVMVQSIRFSRSDPDLQFERFADETLAVACQTLGAEWGSFYRLGDNLRLFGFRSRGIPREFGDAYARRAMENVDPLHAFRLIARKHRFVTMGDARAENPGRHRDFLSFLRSFGAEEAAEMIFRYNDVAVAGLSLVWLGRRPERRTTVDVGTSLQSYIEFNLGNLQESIPRLAAPASSASPCDFTGRELEVIDVVCRGFTNQEIARHLNIGIATVKTHLIHVYKKAGVETRGKLISRVLGAH